MKIDVNTKLVTLLGDPLAQSFAARMQNKAYEAAGLNMLYFYTVTGPDNLEDIVKGIRHMNFAGFAVTKPNKIKVLQYLDGLDPLCEKMGATNTVVKTAEGKLIGYNTDGIGFYDGITEDGVVTKGSTFFSLGAGGAGRAMLCVLAYMGAKKIYVQARHNENAQRLVNDINEHFAPVAEFVPAGDFSKVAESDIVLNSTGVGMGHSIGQNPLPKEYIRPGQVYFDACYNPAKTQFLLDAEEKGCKVINGLGMSLYQGTRQVELWSGQKAPVEVMRKELLTIIEEKKAAEKK